MSNSKSKGLFRRDNGLCGGDLRYEEGDSARSWDESVLIESAVGDGMSLRLGAFQPVAIPVPAST